ncbi:MAG: hypothetical protein K2W96_03780 [Gemmataceae bacterium]|nr:hypothetical protein [Gemmataceae bacterium]
MRDGIVAVPKGGDVSSWVEGFQAERDDPELAEEEPTDEEDGPDSEGQGADPLQDEARADEGDEQRVRPLQRMEGRTGKGDAASPAPSSDIKDVLRLAHVIRFLPQAEIAAEHIGALPAIGQLRRLVAARLAAQDLEPQAVPGIGAPDSEARRRAVPPPRPNTSGDR